MQSRRISHQRTTITRYIVIPLLLVVLVSLTQFVSKPFFHTVAEMFSITVGFGIFVVGYNARKITHEPYTQFLAVAFLFVASFDITNLLVSPEIQVIGQPTQNMSMQVNIVARFVQAGSLLAATWFVGKNIHWRTAWAAFALVFWPSVAAIVVWHVFPDVYFDGIGFTPFGFAAETVIILILAAGLVRLWQKRAAFHAEVFNWLVIGMGASILSELGKILYTGNLGISFYLGHILKVVAFFAFYRAVVYTGITQPFSLFLRSEKERELALQAEVAARTAELRASEARFKRLTERLPDVVYRYDLAEPRRYTYINPTIEQITGYKPEDFYTDPKLFFNITHPDDQPFWTITPNRFENFPWHQTVLSRVQHKNGHWVWIEERIVPIYDKSGKLVALEGIVRDITATKQAEDTLKQHATRMALLYRTATRLNASLDLETVLSSLLQEVENLFNTIGGEVWLVDTKNKMLVCLSASHSYQQSVIGKQMPLTEGLAGATIAEKKTLVVKNAAADPRYRPLFDAEYARRVYTVANVPLHGRNRIIGVIQIGTERGNAFSEDDIQFLEALAGVAAIAIENAQLYRQAIDDAQTKLTLLKEVNHRVKNNLAAISGLLYLEKRKMGKLLDKTYEESIQNLINRVQGLSAVHNLLSATEWHPVSLKLLVDDIVRTTIRATSHHQVSVAVHVPDVQIQSEQAHHLGLVINELTINSLKHAVTDDGILQINVTGHRNDDIITLTLRDNGGGYPPEILHQPSQPGHIGFDLLKSIVQKNLSGTCKFFNDNGAVAEITFTPDVLEPTTHW